jgi:hypothetical protein
MSVPESNYRAWLRKAEHDLLFKPTEDDGLMKETGPPRRRASSRPAFVTLISRPAAAAAAHHP